MSDDRQKETFIERMGLVADRDGQAPISGHIWGYLMLQDKPVSAQAIAEELGVSRASISTNTRRLREMGVIQLRTRPGDRQHYYEMADAPFRRATRLLVERFETHCEELEKSRTELVGTAAEPRIAALMEFYSTIGKAMIEATSKLSER